MVCSEHWLSSGESEILVGARQGVLRGQLFAGSPMGFPREKHQTHVATFSLPEQSVLCGTLGGG